MEITNIVYEHFTETNRAKGRFDNVEYGHGGEKRNYESFAVDTREVDIAEYQGTMLFTATKLESSSLWKEKME
eukprot:9601780-Ditylum_brightwellii.AAC.1